MKHFIIAGLMIASTSAQSQVITNMPFSTPELSNPAFTGMYDQSRLSLYSGFGQYFSQYYAGYSQYSNRLNGGLGAYVRGTNINFDTQTKGRSYAVGLSYAYQHKINENWRFSSGLSAEFGQANYYNFPDNYPSLIIGLKAGGLIYSDHFFSSLTVNAFTYDRFLVQSRTGYQIKPFENKDFSITPILTYQYDQYHRLALNIELAYKRFHIGGGISGGRGNLSAGIDFKRFRINYNYGNLSNDFKYNTHQFSLQFKIGSSKNRASKAFNKNLF